MGKTVLIVEDDELVSRCTRRTLAKSIPDLTLVVAPDLEAACARVQDFSGQRDLVAVILDLHLPDGNGEKLIPMVIQHCPGARIIVTSAYLDDATSYRLQRHRVLALPKPITAPVLLAALQEPPPSHTVAPSIGAFAQTHGLSARQRQAVEGLVDGKSVKDMAAELGISVNSMAEHVKRALKKTGCSSRSDLIRAVRGAAGSADQ